MKHLVDEKKVKKVKCIYRVLSFFICMILFICLIGVITFGLQESLTLTIALSSVFVFMLYVFIPIVIKKN